MKKIINIILLALVAGIIALGISNFQTNTLFFEASLISCLSLLAVIGFSFFFVQRMTDSRKQRDIMLKLAESLLELVSCPDSYKISNDEKACALISRKRDMSNRITTLLEYSKKMGIVEEIDFVKSKFDEYEQFISNHINNIPYLEQSEKELQRPLGLIAQKLYGAMLKLYE